MPTYIYETVPGSAGEEPLRFEIEQRMSDAPLATHPDTGQPVRRVIAGGSGLMLKGGPPRQDGAKPAPRRHTCSGGCRH